VRTDRWWGVFYKVRGIIVRGHKGVGRGWVEMELLEESFLSPEFVPLFIKGDLVHVFEGTGSGQVKMRSVGWFGRVLGMKEGKYMVRNRILAGKGSPALIQGEYLTLRKDFGLGMGSEERTHFRSLSKRTRTRIEESADRRNGFAVEEAQKQIKKLKTKITTETAAHRDRYEKTAAQGKAGWYQTSLDHKGHMDFWRSKCSALETKKAEQVWQHKVALAKMIDTHKQQYVSVICNCFLHSCVDIILSVLLVEGGQRVSQTRPGNTKDNTTNKD
jgi:hypothetical protein